MVEVELLSSMPLTSLGGVVMATMFIVMMIKDPLGRVPWIKEVPVWGYAVAVAAGLTVFAAFVLETLPQDWNLVWQSVVAAASASGFREWWQAKGKSAEESNMTRFVQEQD